MVINDWRKFECLFNNICMKVYDYEFRIEFISVINGFK